MRWFGKAPESEFERGSGKAIVFPYPLFDAGALDPSSFRNLLA